MAQSGFMCFIHKTFYSIDLQNRDSFLKFFVQRWIGFNVGYHQFYWVVWEYSVYNNFDVVTEATVLFCQNFYNYCGGHS